MEDQNYILFESYLSGDLTIEEVAAFELRLKKEPELVEAFNAYKELFSFLQKKFQNETASEDFRQKLETISDAHFNKLEADLERNTFTKTFSLYKYAIVACVVVLLGIFTFNQLTKPAYSDYNDFGTISLTVRGENNDLLQDAEHAFNSKDFAKADEVFKRLMASDDENVELKLYRALINLEINNFELADSLLIEISQGQSVYKNTATWYLALSKLKQKNIEACIKILKSIPADAEEYEKAQNLIDKLN